MGPGVNHRTLVDVVHGGHDAILEFLFGCDTNAAQGRPAQLGKEALDNVQPRTVLGCLLDYVIISNETHLRRVLSSYFQYYHKSRTHIALNKDCPQTRPISSPATGKIVSVAQVGGLHHWYERQEA
jgi:hypothetical protein